VRTLGVSLVEVLVALVVLAAGILPAVYGVTAALTAAERGHARAELAAALLSRASLLRACGVGEVLLEAERVLPGGPVADTLRVRVVCP
jgi:hypothetical protein